MQPDEIKIEKEIFDNVIGFIGLTDLELEIIGTPIFQRLRHIKQLGLANYVFPGALQNRFNHSIGVLHYADEMICSLQKNETEENEILKGTRELIRMAALLHDVGHYPLSHITEMVVIKDAELISSPYEKRIISEKLSDENKSEKEFHHQIHELNLSLHKPLGNNFAHHERMSNLVIQKTEIYDILKKRKRFSKDEILKIQEIIAGIHPSFETQIIHSELDADKFDYLIRDSHQTGVTYGVFDVKQIIRNLKLTDKGELVVGEKGKRAVEHYLMSKYFLYSQVIHHKTVASFNLMAQIVYKGLLERGIAWSYLNLLDKLDDTIQPSYLKFNDEYFFDLMRCVDKGKINLPNGSFLVNDDKLKAFIKMLLSRKRLKLIDEQQELSTKETQKIDEFTEPVIISVCKEADMDSWWFIQDKINVKPTKINPFRESGTHFGEDSESVKVLINENSDAINLIDDKSSIIKPLSLYQLDIRRIYTHEKYEQKLKKAIINHRKNNDS